MFYKSLEKPFSGLVFTSNAALSECHWENILFSRLMQSFANMFGAQLMHTEVFGRSWRLFRATGNFGRFKFWNWYHGEAGVNLNSRQGRNQGGKPPLRNL